jgi:hypothetical protein
MPTSDEIASELESFYRHYANIFNRQDNSFFACYAPVFQLVSSEGALTSVSNETSFWDGFMKALKQRGWARSEVDRVKAWALADNLGMIIADITRRKADNSAIDQTRGMYTARRSGDSWQFIVLFEIAPPHPGPGDMPRDV